MRRTLGECEKGVCRWWWCAEDTTNAVSLEVMGQRMSHLREGQLFQRSVRKALNIDLKLGRSLLMAEDCQECEWALTRRPCSLLGGTRGDLQLGWSVSRVQRSSCLARFQICMLGSGHG